MYTEYRQEKYYKIAKWKNLRMLLLLETKNCRVIASVINQFEKRGRITYVIVEIEIVYRKQRIILKGNYNTIIVSVLFTSLWQQISRLRVLL